MASVTFTAATVSLTTGITAAVKLAKSLSFTSYVLVPVPGYGMFQPYVATVRFPMTRPLTASAIAFTTDYNFGGELSTQALRPIETEDLAHTIIVYNGTTEPILRTFYAGDGVLATEATIPLLTEDGLHFLGVGSGINFITGSAVVSFVKANKQFSSTIAFTTSSTATWAFKKGFSSTTGLTTAFSGTHLRLNPEALSSIGTGDCNFVTSVPHPSLTVTHAIVPFTYGRPVIPVQAPNFMNS